MIRAFLMFYLAFQAICVASAPLWAAVPLKTICRVKGQEDNTLHGLGLVVGLKGTGDGSSFLPTIRSMAVALEMLGNPLARDAQAELKDAKNVALVLVTARVPPAGGRQGDRIDCRVHSVGSCKSLAGGYLFLTPLVGPDPRDRRVYAMAEGPLTIESTDTPTVGKIAGGCRLEADFFNPFVKDGRVTLVIDPPYADFQVAQDIVELINTQMTVQSGGMMLARALNQVNVEVLIPRQYADDPVLFVSQLMELPLLDIAVTPRVVVNERTGSIIISGDVEIGPVVVTHGNMVIQAGGAQFVPVDSSQTQTTKLKALVDALNALNTPPQDIIEIIKGLEKDGKLRGRLIIE